MNYFSSASSTSHKEAHIKIKATEIAFGITPETAEELPSPAELFLGSISSCILKNVERFSGLMNFTYSNAEIIVTAQRMEKPPRMDEISYTLRIFSEDAHLNVQLLKKNIENYGTIFNTVKSCCSITGQIQIVTE